MKDWFQGLTCDDGKNERCLLRSAIFRATIVGIVCAAVILWTLKAFAVEIPVQVLEKDGVEIRLMPGPCVDPVSISLINPRFLERFKAIDSVWPEKDGTRKAYAGCWALLTAEEAGGEEAYLLVFSDGASGAVPKSEFKKVRGQSAI